MRKSVGKQSVYSQYTRLLQDDNYLCASFLMLGVPSKSVERLSGLTINTFAMLQKKQKKKKNKQEDKTGNQDYIIFCGRNAVFQ